MIAAEASAPTSTTLEILSPAYLSNIITKTVAAKLDITWYAQSSMDSHGKVRGQCTESVKDLIDVHNKLAWETFLFKLRQTAFLRFGNQLQQEQRPNVNDTLVGSIETTLFGQEQMVHAFNWEAVRTHLLRYRSSIEKLDVLAVRIVAQKAEGCVQPGALSDEASINGSSIGLTENGSITESMAGDAQSLSTVGLAKRAKSDRTDRGCAVQ